jgi:putative ABC transport system permease protein
VAREAREHHLDPRWVKIVRDLWNNKFRTMLVVASIAVGVFAVAIVLGGRAVLLASFEQGYRGSAPANATFLTSDFSDELLAEVRRDPSVRYADARRAVSLRMTTDSNPTSSSAGWTALQVEAVPDFTNQRVQKFVRDKGSEWPPRAGELALEKSALIVGSYSVGQTLTVEAEDGKRSQLRISAIAHDINAFPAMFVGDITGYIAPETLRQLGQPNEFNELFVIFEGNDLNRAQTSRMAAALRDHVLVPAGVQVLNTAVPNPGSHFLGDIFRALSLLLLALGVLALALSGFLVVTTISAIMAQQVRQIGIMKAVGGKRGQIAGMYVLVVAIYGVLAVMVGLPVGWFAGRWFIDFAAGLLNFPVYSYVPDWYVLGLEIAVGIAAPLLAAAVPIAQGARMPVAQSLSDTGMGGVEFGHGLLDRILGALRGLPRPVALSLRNTFLRKGRLALTLTTLILASSVVMAVFSVRGSILQTVDDIGSWWNYDAQVYFSRPQPAADAERTALKVPGVTEAESWLQTPVSFQRADGSENARIYAIGLPPKTDFVTPNVTQGRWLTPEDVNAIVVNSDVAKDEPQMRVGKKVRLNVRGAEEEFEVVGIVQGQMMGPVVFTPEKSLEALLGGGSSATTVLVKTASPTRDAQQTVAVALEDAYAEQGLAVSGSETQTGMVQRLSDELGLLVTFLAIMGALLALVGVIGLTGTMTINVLESTREIGVMRSIGASHGSIFGIFITEAVVIGVISWAAGAVLSWPLSFVLARVLGDAMSIPLTYVFSWFGVGVWLASVVAIAVVASLVPSWRASQISVRDAIAYE